MSVNEVELSLGAGLLISGVYPLITKEVTAGASDWGQPKTFHKGRWILVGRELLFLLPFLLKTLSLLLL